MEAELFREIHGRFLLNELGDPTFLFHLFKENTTLHDIFKLLFSFEIFRLIHYYSQILGVSLEPCGRSICLLFQISFIATAILRRFTVTMYFYHKSNAYFSLLVITLLK